MEVVYKRLLYVTDKSFPYVISKTDPELINACDVKVSKRSAIFNSFREGNSKNELNIGDKVTGNE